MSWGKVYQYNIIKSLAFNLMRSIKDFNFLSTGLVKTGNKLLWVIFCGMENQDSWKETSSNQNYDSSGVFFFKWLLADHFTLEEKTFALI